MNIIDNFLDKITMYKLTLYYLIILVGAAISLSLLGIHSYDPVDIIYDTALAVAACYIANHIFAWIFRTNTNSESVFITALILVLIIPVKLPLNFGFIVIASILSMGIKYLPVIEKRHIFNPVAGAVLSYTLLFPRYSATWWVGTPWLLPFVVIGGLLLMRKTQRENLVFIFLSISLILISGSSFIHGGTFFSAVRIITQSIFRSPLFFFAFVMLLEPLTSPTTEKLRGWYAALVAVLYSTPQLRLFGLIFTPEMALCIGNVFSYLVSPWSRFTLKLIEKTQTSFDTIDFVFSPSQKFSFTPGQYMEWTLSHKGTDGRGNRRYFTIASSPSEENIRIGVKFYEKRSSYKNAMYALSKGSTITASQIAGEFVLPKDDKRKIVFMAGGIGITPFRSIIKYLLDKKIARQIILLYSNKNAQEIAYKEIFDKAQAELRIKTVYTLTNKESIPTGWQGEVGRVDGGMIKRQITDYNERLFYLSGPHAMVAAFEEELHQIGISGKNIKKDFFPGF